MPQTAQASRNHVETRLLLKVIRGRPNSSLNVALYLEAVAELHGLAEPQFSHHIARNQAEIFLIFFVNFYLLVFFNLLLNYVEH